MKDTQPFSVLVLGTGGRLGRLLRAAWAMLKPDDTALFFQSTDPLPEPFAIRWAPGQDPARLPSCDAVIALWGQTSGDDAELAANVTLADHSRAVAMACGATKLIHLSSAAVYGPVSDATEATPPAPINAYGRSKLDMEARVRGFNDAHLRHICLRLANVVGADSLAPALKGPGPVILDRFADGMGPVRSYIGAFDLAQVLLALTQLPSSSLPAILNVAAQKAVCMEDLARVAQKEVQWRQAPPEAVQTVTLRPEALGRLLPRLYPTADAATLIAQLKAQEQSTKA